MRTVFVRNFNYWGKIEGNVDEVIFTPIGNDATRVAALLSGEIDVMEPVPLQDVERIKSASGLTRACRAPSCAPSSSAWTRSATSCCSSSVKGKNPFKDKRVRQAFYQAIDIETIKTRVMRGASTPTGADGRPRRCDGFQPDMNKRLPYDLEAAKKLLAEAGYPNGFEVTMNCPNDRYVNDAADLPGGGCEPGAHRRQDQPAGRDQGHLLPEDPAPRHQLLPAGLDAEHLRLARRADGDHGHAERQGPGPVQPGRLQQPQARRADAEDPVGDRPKQAQRDDQARPSRSIQDDVGHIPLHQQALAWAHEQEGELRQLPDNYMFFKWISSKSK